jgi:hydroxymethylbilane synthase
LNKATLRIATRESALALWQAEYVAARLRALHRGLVVELVPMTTRGDQIMDRPLAQVGGKGLFLKELEVAMQEGRAELAVHSMKDVPAELEPGFAIAAVLERADPFDAFVSTRYPDLTALPAHARVGTSSLRRQAQLRGNVNTRLAKLDAGQYDAVILACAGLDRLGFGARIRSRLLPPDWLPAVAQGAIGIECRAEDSEVMALLAPLAHAPTAICVAAERAMNLTLHGGCDVPIAGYAVLDGAFLRLSGLVGDAATGRIIRAAADGRADAPETLGRGVGEQLLAAGADALLQR